MSDVKLVQRNEVLVTPVALDGMVCNILSGFVLGKTYTGWLHGVAVKCMLDGNKTRFIHSNGDGGIHLMFDNHLAGSEREVVTAGRFIINPVKSVVGTSDEV